MEKNEIGDNKRSRIDWDKLKEYDPEDIRIRHLQDCDKFELTFEGEVDY